MSRLLICHSDSLLPLIILLTNKQTPTVPLDLHNAKVLAKGHFPVVCSWSLTAVFLKLGCFLYWCSLPQSSTLKTFRIFPHPTFQREPSTLYTCGVQAAATKHTRHPSAPGPAVHLLLTLHLNQQSASSKTQPPILLLPTGRASNLCLLLCSSSDAVIAMYCSRLS